MSKHEKTYRCLERGDIRPGMEAGTPCMKLIEQLDGRKTLYCSDQMVPCCDGHACSVPTPSPKADRVLAVAQKDGVLGEAEAQRLAHWLNMECFTSLRPSPVFVSTVPVDLYQRIDGRWEHVGPKLERPLLVARHSPEPTDRDTEIKAKAALAAFHLGATRTPMLLKDEIHYSHADGMPATGPSNPESKPRWPQQRIEPCPKCGGVIEVAVTDAFLLGKSLLMIRCRHCRGYTAVLFDPRCQDNPETMIPGLIESMRGGGGAEPETPGPHDALPPETMTEIASHGADEFRPFRWPSFAPEDWNSTMLPNRGRDKLCPEVVSGAPQEEVLVVLAGGAVGSIVSVERGTPAVTLPLCINFGPPTVFRDGGKRGSDGRRIFAPETADPAYAVADKASVEIGVSPQSTEADLAAIGYKAIRLTALEPGSGSRSVKAERSDALMIAPAEHHAFDVAPLLDAAFVWPEAELVAAEPEQPESEHDAMTRFFFGGKP